ncbi:acetolactate synthase large subunit [Solwaraspora sp. WMMD406]|uniref:acetolactate synthase large subunit n=1 Tax=Solwaraspora sp. WMMD406 TaxID=3016095 RepID=UPI0024173355|nr:acetolactate synthase large subunit [Solwaraspora sp. WMMD406]MDG4767291.1 acetolactate synthase large subunit [Solwaraspora sp. WMMD406]
MTRPTPETLAHRAQPASTTPTPATLANAVTPPPAPPVAVSGAGSLVRSLEALGVDVVFGIPGGAILPAYDPLYDSTVRHILVRHEQGAGHAATGYAQATGRVGVCMATSGPGATNLVTPIADAYMDSVPIVAITGQVARPMIGTDAFQEADIQGITLPITKHNYLVQSGEEIPRVLAEAFHLAATGRPGPVLVDIPKDVLQAQTTFAWPPTLDLPGYRPTLHPHGKQIREAARLMATARRPVLYVGGGVLKAQATEGLRKLAELTNIPVVTTLMARGAFPDSHQQHLGMPGMHGTVAAVYALQKADLLVALGARFDDRVTGKLDSFAPGAAIVHADIDPAEIGKNRAADVPIVGDARHVIDELIEAYPAAAARVGSADRPVGPTRTGGARGGAAGDRTDWWAQLDDLRQRYPLGYDEPDDGTLSPQYVIERLGKLAGPDAIYVAGVGQHQMWASQFISYEKPNTWLNSGGLGTMGYAVPAAMGAKVGRPQTVVWAVDGDGCFQMTNQELATCALEGIPVKVAVINNGNLGMVRQWQTLFYDQRYSNTDLGTHKHRIPDFVKLAEALGCVGLRCENAADVDKTIAAAMEIDDVPVVIDFVVGKDAMVWPMVAAGTSNDEIMFARDVRPDFDDDDL